MYKLLVTTALVAITATSVSANNWTGGAQLVQDLETIYDSLDGGTQFGQLQSDSTIVDTKHGQLDGFFATVDKGVTYITLTVDANNNITPTISDGVTFQEIQDAKDDLVNRVNYDLFVDTNGDNYDAGQTYTTVKAQNDFALDGTPENTADNDYVSSHNAGLAGVKIAGLVTTVNTANDFLIAETTTATQADTFRTEFRDNGVASTDTTVSKIFGDIADLNVAINTASTEGNFFDSIDGGTFTEANVNSYVIPSYVSFEEIGSAGAGGFGSISDWANGVQTINVDPGVTDAEFTFTGTEALTVVSATVVNVAGVDVTIADDSRFTAK